MLIGLPTLRLRGDYLAIVTLGFGEILPQIARNGDNFFNTGVNVTNGPQGITPIDGIGFGHARSALGLLPANYLTAANSDRLFFWTAIVLVLITLFCSLRLRGRKLGRAWIAIREDETAAAAMGVPLMRTKTLAYAIGAFFGGVAGAYFAEFTTGANPDSFSFNFSVVRARDGDPRRDRQRLGRDGRRRLPRLSQPGGPRQHRRLDQRAPSAREHRRARSTSSGSTASSCSS